MNAQNSKRTFMLLSISPNEKLLRASTITDADITVKKFDGKSFMEDTCNYLLEIKSKNLEGVILDLYKHNDLEFLVQLRKQFVEFCESKKILYRLISFDVLFTSMLLCHSELLFKDEEKVYSIWIKKNQLVSYKVQNGMTVLVKQIEFIGDNFDDKKFDDLLDYDDVNPKFLILGSQTTDARLKMLKDRFKAKNIKVVTSNFEDCLKKSASHFLSRLIRAQNFRWNLKLHNPFELKMVTHRAQSLILFDSAVIDVHPFEETIDLPDLWKNIKLVAESNDGLYVSHGQQFDQITVKVDEDGFAMFYFPSEDDPKHVIDKQNDENSSCRKGAKTRPKFYIFITTPDPVKHAIEVWQVIDGKLFKVLFDGKNLLNDLCDHISKMTKQFLDCIVINLFEHNDPDFIWSARQHLFEFCHENDYFYQFICRQILYTSMLLFQSKIEPEEGSIVNVMFPVDGRFLAADVKIEEGSWDIVDRVKFDKETDDIALEMEDIIQRLKYSILGTMDSDSELKYYKRIFSNDKIIVIPDNFVKSFIKNSDQIFQEIFNVENSKWDLTAKQMPTDNTLFGESDVKNQIKCFEPTILEDIFPFQVLYHLPNGVNRFYICRILNETGGYYIEYNDDVVEDNNYIIDVEEDGFVRFMLPLKYGYFDTNSIIYKDMATKFTIDYPDRQPIVIFSADLAMLFVHQNGSYSPISIDGQKGLRTYISFVHEKPLFGQEAADKRFNKDNKPFVVYDFLKLMSMNADDEIDQKGYWGFKIVKHASQESVLYEFQTREGIRHATPQFLMAMIVKELAKVYKKQFKENLTNVILPNIYENERVLKKLKDTLYLLNIDCV